MNGQRKRRNRRALNELVDSYFEKPAKLSKTSHCVFSHELISSEIDPVIDGEASVEFYNEQLTESQTIQRPGFMLHDEMEEGNSISVDSSDENDFSSDPTSGEASDDIVSDVTKVANEINISQNDLTKILKMLNKYHPELPVNARTLLRASNEKLLFREVPPGTYYHFGLRNGLIFVTKTLRLHLHTTTLYLQVNFKRVILSLLFILLENRSSLYSL